LAICSTKSKFAQDGVKCKLSKSAHHKKVTVIYMPCDFLRALYFGFLCFGKITIYWKERSVSFHFIRKWSWIKK